MLLANPTANSGLRTDEPATAARLAGNMGLMSLAADAGTKPPEPAIDAGSGFVAAHRRPVSGGGGGDDDDDKNMSNNANSNNNSNSNSNSNSKSNSNNISNDSNGSHSDSNNENNYPNGSSNVDAISKPPAHDRLEQQIRSNSSTPPAGVLTPHPDPVDKRLPGIAHSYFGQVRASPCSPLNASSLFPVPPSPSASNLPVAADGVQRPTAATDSPSLGLEMASAGYGSGSNDDCDDGLLSTVDLLPHERLQCPSIAYPTPPSTTSSSPVPATLPGHAGRPDGSASNARTPSPLPLLSPPPPVPSATMDGSLGSDARPAGDGIRPAQTRAPPVPAAPSAGRRSHLRRHTYAFVDRDRGLLVNAPTGSVAQLSKPAITRLPPTFRSRSGSQPSDELRKLTGVGRFTRSNQNTPPHTPRSRSREAKRKHVDGTSTPTAPVKSADRTVAASKSTGPSPPQGKLSVLILEGRNLRPSVDPYVVCQFQWSEYISDGPIKADGAGQKYASSRKGPPNSMATRRTDKDSGRPMPIPMKSRQSSSNGVHESREPRLEEPRTVTDPKWVHEVTFDVVGEQTEIDISVYDRSNQEAFLGHVRLCPNLKDYSAPAERWFVLDPLTCKADSSITGEIRLRIAFQVTDKKHFGPDDFQILKLIGKGTFGQVFQVRKKDTRRIYAMKILSKKVIVQKKEVAHTVGERNILVRTAMAESVFIVGLKFSFQTPTDLYLVTDYMSGGELFWHLQREGRFGEARAKFYIAELILALQHLHDHNIVYRDLKPENILLDANGHIALCDFGLSKANLTKDDKTTTFCGTTEYLAPEVLLDEAGYTKMVDFWSLGVLVFEMCCGWSPFYAEETEQMYKNIAFGKVRFPRDALSLEGRNFVKGLLNRNPRHRLGANGDAAELIAHPFFADVDWPALARKEVVPPFKPKLKSELDVSNFDPEFTNALTGPPSSLNARAAALACGLQPASTPLSPTVQAKFKGFTFVDESAIERNLGAGAGGGSVSSASLARMDEHERERERERDADDADDADRLGRRPDPFAGPNRMSGIIPGADADDHGIFTNANFDM